MKMQVEFKVLVSSYAGEMEKFTNKAIAEGWQVQSSHVVNNGDKVTFIVYLVKEV